MEKPLALKLKNRHAVNAYRVGIDPDVGKQIQRGMQTVMPAILMASETKIIDDICVVDGKDVALLLEGSWSDAVLIVPHPNDRSNTQPAAESYSGDSKFLASVKTVAPNLEHLAAQTVAALRAAGVEGELVEGDKGRWINRPLNTFTLKAQPRKGDLQFTLYGDPRSYDAVEFLRPDQNSYSRGWVRNLDDIKRLAELARQSHSRRKRQGR